jgi:hypothetical protein
VALALLGATTYASREEQVLLQERPSHSQARTRSLERGEEQSDGRLHLSIGIEHDSILAFIDEADGQHLL